MLQSVGSGTDIQTGAGSGKDWAVRALLMLALAGLTVFLFRTLLISSAERWLAEPQYSHGMVVPLMAAGLAWCRRDRISRGSVKFGVWGLALLTSGVLLHFLAVQLSVATIDIVSFLMCLAGSVLLVFGRRVFLSVWPAILFCIFMFPLPLQLDHLFTEPLQVMGAKEAAWYIQTCGIPAVAHGNVILMGSARTGVADVCSGLRMFMLFFAVSVAAALISRRAPWEKVLILLSAVPIAMICGILRIVFTAVIIDTRGPESAGLMSSGMTGLLQIPVAMLMLFAELKLFDWLFVEVDDRSPVVCVPRALPRAASMTAKQ